MIFLIARILAFFGVDITKAQRIAIFILIGAGLIVILVLGLWLKSCLTKTPKLNEQEIQAAQKAIKDRNDAELKRILIESDVREAEIDANVSNAEAATVNATKESRDKWANANTNELAAELEKRSKQ